MIKIKFLGWGNAWPNNWFANNDYTIERLAAINEDLKKGIRPKDQRYRTSLYITANNKNILVDCGPDFAQQRDEFELKKPDLILLTHEHFDHALGLFDLEVYKRASQNWKPIPTYAHPNAWKVLDGFFGYLYAAAGTPGFETKLLEKRNVDVWKSEDLEGITLKAFKTYHGAVAPGSVGYVIEDEKTKMAYTSDFSKIIENEAAITNGKPLDVLVIEANWFNEPKENKWGHMSFQNSIQYIKKWNPKQVYFVHMGDEDLTLPPLNPLIDPIAHPKDIPKTYNGWNKAIREYFNQDHGLNKYLSQETFVGHEGLEV